MVNRSLSGDKVKSAKVKEIPKAMGLYRRSTIRSIVTIGFEYFLIVMAVTIGQAISAVWIYPLFVLFVGTRQYALSECMAHEASHRNLSSIRWLNELLGMAVCWPFFVTLGGYRRFHNRMHHGVSLEDNENSIYEDYEDWGLPTGVVLIGRWRGYWLFIFKPLVGLMGVTHLRKALADFYLDGDLKENAIMLTFWFVIIALSFHFFLLDELIVNWIIPWLVVVPVLNYWSEVGDHYRVTGASTRSNISWIWNKLIAHNIGYHALHHRYPSIPWFRLASAYPIFRSELREQVSEGYLMSFRQIMAAKPAFYATSPWLK